MAMLIRNRMGNFLSQPVPFSMMHKQTLLKLPRHGPWRRQWHPTPVVLPGKSHGRRSLISCSPWGRQELDTTELLHFHFLHIINNAVWRKFTPSYGSYNFIII